MSNGRWIALLVAAVAFALTTERSAFAQKGSKAKQLLEEPSKAQASKDAAKKLRSDWKLADLKMQREAVEEGTFPADVKKASIQAVEWYISQQESLVADVQKNPQNEGKARAQRASLDQTFQQRMSALYSNPTFMKELTRQMRALAREMEEMAVATDRIFARLDAVGATPDQKKKIEPVVAEAKHKITSARSKDEKEEAVESYKQAKAKVRQQLTKEQKEKLQKKLADEA